MRVLFAMMLAVTMFVAAAQSSARTLDEIRGSELRVGVAVAIPWVMTDSKHELLGSEIDIADLLASDLGTTPAYHIMNWAELVPALNAGKIDVIISGLSITPKRALDVAFSIPYGDSTIGLLARRDAPIANAQSPADANLETTIIGATEGTLGAEVAHVLFFNASVVEYPSFARLVSELQAGTVQAIVASQPLPRIGALEEPNAFVEPMSEPLHRQVEAIAVPHGNQELLNFLNAWIALRNADGFLARTHAYWFGGTDWMSRFSGQFDKQPAGTELGGAVAEPQKN